MATLQDQSPATDHAEKSALLISAREQDHEFLRGIFQQNGWTLLSAHSLGPAASLLRNNEPAIIITEKDLPVGTWKDVLAIVHLLSTRPLVIVVSRLADDYLWAEALNLGAYDVLAKPFSEQKSSTS